MAFTISTIAQALLLVLNALAILSEKRFLAKYGLMPSNAVGGGRGPASAFPSGSPTTITTGFGVDFGDTTVGAASPFTLGQTALDGNHHGGSAMKQQVANFLGSIRMIMRWPLIIVNSVVIVVVLVFG